MAAGRLARVCAPIADLTLNPMNPRVHSPRQIRQIARSIKPFGFNVPVSIDHEKRIVAGHGYILAWQSARLDGGADHLPRAPRTETQKVARRLAAGRIRF
jgi:ParB-like chromosome segregation protein Spo0J